MFIDQIENECLNFSDNEEIKQSFEAVNSEQNTSIRKIYILKYSQLILLLRKLSVHLNIFYNTNLIRLSIIQIHFFV